ncbi:MAG: hypothetical protein KDA72_22685, partial [Planctomycetales bacterium]|nr:hypothetical protein [Planctomycetales bacterium]
PSENDEAAVEVNPTAERRATLQVEDNPTAERRATLQEQPSESASPTDYLLSSSFDGQLRLWNMADGTSIRTWQGVPRDATTGH